MEKTKAGPRTFPRFEANRWKARLNTPPEYRATSLRRQFESGRIGGKRIEKTVFFHDSVSGRRELQTWWRQNMKAPAGADVYYIRSPRHHRQRVHGGEILRPGFSRDGILD